MTSSVNSGGWRWMPGFLRRSPAAPILPSEGSQQQIEALAKACSTMQPLPEGNEGIEQLKEMRNSEVYTICYNLADLYYANQQGISFQEKLESAAGEIRRILNGMGVDYDQVEFLLKLAFLERGLYEAVWQARGQFKETGALSNSPESPIAPVELTSFREAYAKLTEEENFSLKLLSVYSLSLEKALRALLQQKMLINAFGNDKQVLSQICKLDAELFAFAAKQGICGADAPSVSLIDVIRCKNHCEDGRTRQTVSRLIQSRASLVWVYNRIAREAMELDRARQLLAPVASTPVPAPIPSISPVVTTGVAYPSLTAPVSFPAESPIAAPPREKREEKRVRDEEGGALRPSAAAPSPTPEVLAIIRKLEEMYQLRQARYEAPRPLDSMDVILKKRALFQPAFEIITGLGLKQKTEEEIRLLSKQFIRQAESSEIFNSNLFFYYIFEAAKAKGIDTSEDRWAEKHGIDDVNVFVAGLTRYTKEYLI